ncbi:carboxy terminal-processing peptidase [Marinomonas sp. 15G1-11]|uniref:Carboxy terminal-processing peptidase n=1 Tax=Marinomonas phaeophyticola TaxID=3004091 RepID=A0ABT4JQ92_9GAMM|nr:carboxy terminal-processing peptidase [Marinomonas sp. 15G1-11]MCZ2720530.1 carboxy terminal-processing peptidase [Marinomonas sp. 15G1-11]
MNYKHLFICLLMGATLSASHTFAYNKLKPLDENKEVSQQLVEILERVHYNKTVINDEISSMAFNHYLDYLDPSKSFFLQSDIDSFSKYKLTFDDALRSGDTEVAYTIYNVFLEHLETRLNKLIADLPAMIKGFDYTKDEVLNIDPDQLNWSDTQAELDEIWRKRIKNRALILKMNDQTEEKIIESLTRRYKNQLKQIEQTDEIDIFQIFANSITASLDPHTSYFAPRASETFNINMSLSLEGIGAVLQQEDEATKVVRLVPGGPAASQSDLAPNDKIIAVGQDGEEMIDVVGMRLDDVVDMIRGERDTAVNLEIIPSKGNGQTSKIISIIRKKVKLEDQSAQKHIVEIERNGENYKIGVIKLPTFYSDFAAIQAGDQNYKSSTRDTKRLIEELRKEDISGLILDLRGNGGGSLQEANALAGLFIPSGPTVQIRDASGRVSILGDQDRSVTYSGPMAILVNRMSASASEIVAGALQDYGRSIILGGQTFGKGTVQVLQALDKGQLKITQAKFYRVSGESTQHKGVVPDITFPSLLDEDTVGESALDNPLPWDQIHETRYPVYWDIPSITPKLTKEHNRRIKQDPNFISVIEQIDYIKERTENIKTISLNEQDRLEQQKKGEQDEIARENKRREALGLELIESVDDIVPTDEDSYEHEAGEILLDFISLNQ